MGRGSTKWEGGKASELLPLQKVGRWGGGAVEKVFSHALGGYTKRFGVSK